MNRAPTLIALAVIVAAAAGCSSSPPDMTVKGTVEVVVQDYSDFSAYPQITNDSAQVTVTDPSGKVIGVATADNGNVNQGPLVEGDMTETVGFSVKVPEGAVVLRDKRVGDSRNHPFHPGADEGGAGAVRGGTLAQADRTGRT